MTDHDIVLADPELRTFMLDGTRVTRVPGPDGWTFSLGRAAVRTRTEGALDLLTHDHDGLLPCAVTEAEDAVTLHLTVGPALREWRAVARLPRTERLRALANVGALASLVDRGITVLLHPDNLVVDRDLRPRLAYRGIVGAMPPQDQDDSALLRQLQALVLWTADPEADFDELLEGAMELRGGSELERAVLAAPSVAALVDLLLEMHDDEAAVDAARLVRVDRRSYRLFRLATVWLGVLVVVLGTVAGYHQLVRAPAADRLLDASTEFVQGDYDGVIEVLRPVDAADLPATQRYELATAYLRRTNLSTDQRSVVQNTLAVSADPDVLDYWIEIGRGQIDQALDTAQGLDDLDLVLYALTLLQEQVRADATLSGAERESRLRELQEQYDGYLEERSTLLGGDTPGGESSATPEVGG